MLKGIAASPGIEIGKALVLKEQHVSINKDKLEPEQVEKELKRLNEAFELAHTQLSIIKDKAQTELGADKAEIFQAHLMILEDVVFVDDIKNKIETEYLYMENAIATIVDEYVEIFNNMDDELLKGRAADIQDIGNRLVKNGLGISQQDLGSIAEEVIIVSKDLMPSDTAQMNKDTVKAFATDIGGKTSHTAIMARSLDIPAVVGLSNVSSQVKNGDLLIIDGNTGMVCINPDEATLQHYEREKADYLAYLLELKELKNLTGETKDGKRCVELSANIGTPEDCKGALENGAEGVGLYRTEFLYMDRAILPTEEEQYEAYKAVAQAMDSRPVIIRTIDIGGDKKLSYLNMPDEMNPFLGWRAIRMCLDQKDMLRTQLKAILRASCFGRLRIMYPMISNADEIRKANAILQEAKKELDIEGKPYNNNVEVGIMIEVPAAAIIADILAKEVDFFSIGTNDLIQYTVAVDRMNEKITHLYEPFHPSVLRLIKNVIDASHKEGKWTGMCGEMAGDVIASPILLGMGLDEFSMSASSIPRIKKVIRSLTYKEAKEISQNALSLNEPEEIRKLVEAIIIKGEI